MEHVPGRTVGEEITEICRTYQKRTGEFIDQCGQRLQDAKAAFCGTGKGSISWAKWLGENTPLDRQTADRIVAKFDVRQKLSPKFDKLPDNDNQYSSLAKIKDDKKLFKVWGNVSSDEKVTAAKIDKEIARIAEAEKRKEAKDEQPNAQVEDSSAGASEPEQSETLDEGEETTDADGDTEESQPSGGVETSDVEEETGETSDVVDVNPTLVLAQIIKLIESHDSLVSSSLWDMLSQEEDIIKRLVESNPETSADVVDKVSRMMQLLPAKERKVAASDLAEIYGEGTQKVSLPDTHIEACKVVGKLVKDAFGQLCRNFEQWDLNGRRAEGRSLRKTVQRQLVNFGKAALLDEEEKKLFATKFPETLNHPEFVTLWEEEWIPHRKKRKESISESVQLKQLKILSHFDVEQATEIVVETMQKGWKGILRYNQLVEAGPWCGRKPAFPPKVEANTNGAFYKEVRDWAKQELSESLPYSSPVLARFRERGPKVLKAIQQVKLPNFLRGGPEVEEVFQEIMGET